MLRLKTVFANYRNIRPKLVSMGLGFGASTVLVMASMGGDLPLLLTQMANALSGASNVYVSPNGTGDCSSFADACSSFADALTAVAPNGTIHVAAGTYTQALTINKSVTVIGAGIGVTKIDAPKNLPSEGAIVDISGSTTRVDLSQLTVTGPGPTNCGSIMSGVFVESNAYAHLHNMTVTNISDSPLSGCQNGRAILIGWGHGWGIPNTTGTATVDNVTINSYQKTGVEVSGTGSSANIDNNTITGIGPTSIIAANGVEVTYGANASIIGNSISGNDYTQSTDVATGILISQAGNATYVGNNKVFDNGIGLSTDTQSTIANMDVGKITGNRLRNAVAVTTGWSTPNTAYADDSISGNTDSNGSSIVATQGGSHVWGYDAFPTIQTALNAAPTGGMVKIANGTYHEDLSFGKGDVKVYGQSQAGVKIDTTSGYGVDIEHQNNLWLTDLTFISSSANSYALHAYDTNNLSLKNLTFIGPGKSSHTGGVDVNSSQNVSYNNVSASNYGKNGFAVTAQYAATDDYSRNFTFYKVLASGNGWNGIAFYTTNSAGTVGHSIAGINFEGTNNITNNGSSHFPGQGGVFLEGDSDGSFGCTFFLGTCVPRYTITSPGGTLQLGNINFSGNTFDITNDQTAGVNALTSTFVGKTGDQMTTGERKVESSYIFDKLSRSNLGLVQYYDAPSVPTGGKPNGGYEKTNNFNFTWGASSGNGPIKYEYQTSMDPANSNGVLTTGIWDNITNGNSKQNNLNSPKIHSVGAPDGTWYWQVRAIGANGHKSAWSKIWSVTIDTLAPTGLANVSPANGTYTTTANLTKIDWSTANDLNGPVTYLYESSNSSDTNHDGSFKDPVYQSGALNNNEISTIGTPEGTYYWHVRAVDAAGNSTPWTSAWKVTVDDTPPKVQIVSPTDFSHPFSVGPTVVVSALDSGSGLRSLTTSIYDSSNTLLSECGSATATELSAGEMNCDLTSLPNGTYSIIASATDNAGNITKLPATNFTISRVTPLALKATSIIRPSNTGTSNSSNNTSSQAQTSNSSQTDTNNSNDTGHVKGASTTTSNTTATSTNKPTGTKSASATFYGVAWYWWSLIVLVVVAFVYTIYRRANVDDKN